MDKRKKSLITVLLLLVALLIALAGCNSSDSDADQSASESDESQEETEGEEDAASSGEPQKGGEITISYVADVTNFDPIKGTTGNDHALLWPVYENLINFSTELEPEPGLAKSWEVVDDTTLLLELQEGVNFQDGTPFNAEAVKFNIERVNSEESQVTDLNNVESVEVVDEYTVKLHLSEPDSSILLALTDRGGMIVSPTAVEEYGDDYSQNPVGTGPFAVTNHVPNGKIEYTANEDYWQEGQPYLDKMTIEVIPDENSAINALKTGQVDFVPGVQPQMLSSLEEDPNIEVYTKTTLGFSRLYLKKNVEPFNNKNARLAVLYGIDREELIAAINFGIGEAASQPFPEGYWAYNDDIDLQYDPEKAKQLLSEAGLTDVSFTLLTYPIEYWTRLSDAIKGQLEKVGITVNVETLEANVAVDKFFSDESYHALTGNWSGRADPLMTINSLYSVDSFYNPAKFTTDALDSFMADAAATYDQEERADLYGKIVNEAIIEQAVAIPLFYSPAIHATNKRVKGYEPNMLGKPLFSELWVEQ